MMNTEYELTLTRVPMRTARLRYQDNEGTVAIYLEESAVPEYDGIGAEPDSNVKKERIELILARLKEWSASRNFNIKNMEEI